jgi:predicted RNase H-like nuclease
VRVAGVDGCRGGWVVVTVGADPASPSTVEVVPAIASVIDRVRDGALAAVGVDMPIGLAEDGRRLADREARALLGTRRSSLFPTPPAAVLGATDYADALARCRAASGVGLSKQAFNLLPKMRELAAAIDPALQAAIAEVHPETTFTVLGGAPCAHGKRTATGAAERRALLAPAFADLATHLTRVPRGAAVDDVLDAFAAAWTARRIALGTATWLGDPDARDARGFHLTIAV